MAEVRQPSPLAVRRSFLTARDVGRYVRERNAANMKIIKESETEFVLDVTHSLAPQVFDYPLTLKVSLKDAGRLAGATQGDTNLEVTQRGGETFVNVVPNGGSVTVTIK